MKCLETRRTPEGFRRRRYEQDGVRFTTIEVPIEVWRGAVRHDRVAERLAAWHRAQSQLALKQRALRLLAEGWKPIAVAHETGFTERAVQRWVRRSDKSNNSRKT